MRALGVNLAALLALALVLGGAALAATRTTKVSTAHTALGRVIVDSSGRIYEAGDTEYKFSIMSVSKPFVLGE